MISGLEIVNKFEINRPEDIDLEAIAYHYGATIKYRKLYNCAARIIGNAYQAIITVDETSRVERQRFSIGHELGHWLNDRGHYAVCTESDLIKFSHECKSREELANKFSADLLMPDNIFSKYSAKRPILFDSVKELANIFNTSLTATAIRLVETGDYPAMLVCYGKDGVRKWFIRNSEIPYFLYPKKHIEKGTVAYSILSNSALSTAPEEVDADDWVDHENAHKYVLKENSIRGYDDTILTLLWWEDESQLLEFV